MSISMILALDLASRTGWAKWSPGSPLEYGSIVFPGTGTGTGRFFAGYIDWLNERIQQSVDLVVFEGPISGPNCSLQNRRKALGLIGITEGLCYAAKITCREANNVNWRKHFLGKAGGRRGVLKAMCIEESRARGFEPKNDDEADAIGIMDYTAHKLEIPTDWPDRGLLGKVA